MSGHSLKFFLFKFYTIAFACATDRSSCKLLTRRSNAFTLRFNELFVILKRFTIALHFLNFTESSLAILYRCRSLGVIMLGGTFNNKRSRRCEVGCNVFKVSESAEVDDTEETF